MTYPVKKKTYQIFFFNLGAFKYSLPSRFKYLASKTANKIGRRPS